MQDPGQKSNMNLGDSSLKVEFEVMFQAVSEASKICKRFSEDLKNLGVMTKCDKSPVTRKLQIY